MKKYWYFNEWEKMFVVLSLLDEVSCTGAHYHSSLHEFHETCQSVTSHWTGQFTPKMKANAELLVLSSLVWIDSGDEVSQHRLESFHVTKCNGMTSFMEFKIVEKKKLVKFYEYLHSK